MKNDKLIFIVYRRVGDSLKYSQSLVENWRGLDHQNNHQSNNLDIRQKIIKHSTWRRALSHFSQIGVKLAKKRITYL